MSRTGSGRPPLNPDLPETARDLPVGAVLASLRHRAGLTGQQVAKRAGMSQAKISRIENGAAATPQDVEKIARALNAPRPLIDRLTEEVERSNDRLTDWRSTHGPVTNIQREVEQFEATTRVFRVFQPAVVVGLAQTSEYARAILTATDAIQSGHPVAAAEVPTAAVVEAVAIRLRRQVVLTDPGKTFHFVMTETVLGNRFGRPEDMPTQIQRLRTLAAQDNVTLKFIPADSRLVLPPYHGFEMLDDRRVAIDVFNTVVTTQGRADITQYRQLFDALEANATDDIDPILDRYLDLYLDLSRPPPRR